MSKHFYELPSKNNIFIRVKLSNVTQPIKPPTTSETDVVRNLILWGGLICKTLEWSSIEDNFILFSRTTSPLLKFTLLYG